MYKTLLVPLDRSKLAEAPLDYAVWLAEKSGARLVLMNVCGPQDCACEPEQCKIIPEARQYLEEKVRSVEQRMASTGSAVKVGLHLAAGDPATQILGYIDQNQVDLVVMATHGRSGVSRWLIGSVADRVVRMSNKPVRLTKSFAKEKENKGEHPDQRILVLLDGSELSESILPHAIHLARMSGGELILLSVCTPPDILNPISYHLIPDRYPPTRPVQWQKYADREVGRRKKQCSKYLDEVQDRVKREGVSLKTESPLGEPAEEILKYIEDQQIDLVAMATHGRSGIARWRLGSVAEKVLIAASSPVLLIRPTR